MSLNTSVIKYEASFKLEDIKLTTMKTLNNLGRGDGYKTCAESEKGGIELLLYVVEDFKLTIEALKLTSLQDLAEFWKKVLGHGPLEKWKKMLRGSEYKYDIKQHPAPNPDNADYVNFIEVEVAGSGFKRSI